MSENNNIEKPKLNNKWMRAAIPALLIHCSIGSVYCWSSFSGELAQTIGVDSSILGWAFSIAIFFLGMSAAFAGRFIEHDIHKSSLISCICFTVGMLGTGAMVYIAPYMNNMLVVLGIFIFYGTIMGVGLGIGYLTPVKTLLLWFKDNKGLATGISIMGFGLAKAIASPIMNVLVVKVGIANMFFILGAVYFVMMFIGHLLLKKPADWHEDKADTVSIGKIIKNKTFVGAWLMFYLNITSGLALISIEKPLLQLVGVSVVGISLVQSVTAGFNALGRIGLSTLSDHLKDRNTIYKLIFIFSCLICVGTCVTGAVKGSIVAIVVAMLIIVNTGYGGGFSTMPALLESRFGMEHISKIHGLVLSAWAFAGLSGNQLTNLIVKMTGSYETVAIVIACLYAIALIISSTMISPQQKKN